MSLTVTFMPTSKLFSSYFNNPKNADGVVTATFFEGDAEKAVEYFKDEDAKYDIRAYGAGAASPDQKYPLVDVRVYKGELTNGVNNNVYLHFVSPAAVEVFNLYKDLATVPEGETLERELSAEASELADQVEAYFELFRIPLGDNPCVQFSLGEYQDVDIPENREAVLVYTFVDVKSAIDAYMALSHAGVVPADEEEEVLCKQDLFEGEEDESVDGDEIDAIDGTAKA